MQTVLVTGAGSGIGRAAATRFADAGWRVYATDIDTDSLDGLDGCETAALDVTDRESIDAVADRIASEADGLDSLVANAGYAQMGVLEDLPAERVGQQFDVNVQGVLRTVQATLPLLRDAGGTVVAVSSTHGRVTTPGWGAYAASKHAVEALCDTLRMEVADQPVDVAMVEPAWVRTDFPERAADGLSVIDRSERYAHIYDAFDEGTLVGGGPLAVTPERVAETIEAAATATDPDDRYPVGWQARLLVGSRWLPRSLQDRTQLLFVRLFAAVHRVTSGRDG